MTDANLLLGRFDARGLLGGEMSVDAERACRLFDQVKGPLASVEAFAEGIVRVVDSHMEKALRRISVEKGYDPRDFILVSFGGAGPLHACALARALRIAKVLVPNFPGALSAYGILASDVVREYSRTVMLASPGVALERHFLELEQRVHDDIQKENLNATYARSVDLRYAGQGYELPVRWSEDFADRFHALHEAQYGYSDKTRPMEIVNVRVRMTAQTEPIPPAMRLSPGRAEPPFESRLIYCDGVWREGKIYDRRYLTPGIRIAGPAIIQEYSATTFLPRESNALVDAFGNLLVEVHA